MQNEGDVKTASAPINNAMLQTTMIAITSVSSPNHNEPTDCNDSEPRNAGLEEALESFVR